MADHVDAAPYVERSDNLDELLASLSGEPTKTGIRLRWTCPICLGPPQVDDVKKRSIFALDAKKVELVCHCGHPHGDKVGCGFGAKVKVPESEIA